MQEYKVQHKHNGMEKTICGNDFFHALKINGLDHKIWKEVR